MLVKALTNTKMNYIPYLTADLPIKTLILN